MKFLITAAAVLLATACSGTQPHLSDTLTVTEGARDLRVVTACVQPNGNLAVTFNAEG